MNRYFLVWYSTNINQHNRATVVTDDFLFVNEKEFESDVKKNDAAITSLLITGVFEFKCSEDYDEFKRQ